SDTSERTSYYPLEAAFRNGETLRLFVPHLHYLGFSNTVPRDWEHAEWFYFEQRGWLRSWGRGQEALLHQAETQMGARRWAAAEGTYRRVRAIADTVPAALAGQFAALSALGADRLAQSVAKDYLRRWPDGPSAGMMHPTPAGP